MGSFCKKSLRRGREVADAGPITAEHRGIREWRQIGRNSLSTAESTRRGGLTSSNNKTKNASDTSGYTASTGFYCRDRRARLTTVWDGSLFGTTLRQQLPTSGVCKRKTFAGVQLELTLNLKVNHPRCEQVWCLSRGVLPRRMSGGQI